MFAKGLLAALALTSATAVEAELPESVFEIEVIHDLNGDLQSQASAWERDLCLTEVLNA